MNSGLDAFLALREANRVFRRFPVRFSLPLVLLGLAGYASVAVERGRQHLVLGACVLLVMTCLGWLVEIVLSAMCLRARAGMDPSIEQTGEVLRYPGLGSVMVKLFFRCVGWALVACVIWLVCYVVYGVTVQLAIGRAAQDSLIHSHSLIRRGFGTIAFLLVTWLLLYRYMFVLPMLAIVRVSQGKFFGECVAMTKQAWRVALPLAFIEIAPTLAHSAFKLVVWGGLGQPNGGRRVLDLARVVAVECFAAWFILVKTELSLQLMIPQPLGEPEGDGAAVNPSP
jgi:hypothetical protein